jgi:hypothetical protein
VNDTLGRGNLLWAGRPLFAGTSGVNENASPSTSLEMPEKSAWKRPLRAATLTGTNTRIRNRTQDQLFDEKLRMAIELSLMEAGGV